MQASNNISYWTNAISMELLGEGYIAHSPGLVLQDHMIEMMEELPNASYMSTINPQNIKRLIPKQQVIEKKKLKALNAKGKYTPPPGIAHLIYKPFMEVLTFFDRDPTDPALNRPHTVKYVQNLLTSYENREFPKALMTLWDMAAKEVEDEKAKVLAKTKKRKKTSASKKVVKKIDATVSKKKNISSKKKTMSSKADKNGQKRKKDY